MLKCASVVILLSGVFTSPGAEVPELVVRGQMKLTLAGAERVMSVARQRSLALGVAENIAIVDDGGHLLMFLRMDAARPASADTAITKAISAATMRLKTGPLFKGSEAAGNFNLAIEHAAAASGGKLTTLYGGIPIKVGGQVIGAIGVGGGSEEQDVSIAEAGAAALETALSQERPGERRN